MKDEGEARKKYYLTRLFNGSIFFCHIKAKRRRTRRDGKVKQSLNIVKKHVRLSVYFARPKTLRDAELNNKVFFVLCFPYKSINKKRTLNAADTQIHQIHLIRNKTWTRRVKNEANNVRCDKFSIMAAQKLSFYCFESALLRHIHNSSSRTEFCVINLRTFYGRWLTLGGSKLSIIALWESKVNRESLTDDLSIFQRILMMHPGKPEVDGKGDERIIIGSRARMA